MLFRVVLWPWKHVLQPLLNVLFGGGLTGGQSETNRSPQKKEHRAASSQTSSKPKAVPAKGTKAAPKQPRPASAMANETSTGSAEKSKLVEQATGKVLRAASCWLELWCGAT